MTSDLSFRTGAAQALQTNSKSFVNQLHIYNQTDVNKQAL